MSGKGETFEAVGSDFCVRPVELRTDDAPGSIVCGQASPSLSWKLQAGRDDVRQLAYELELSPDPAFGAQTLSSGRLESSGVASASWPWAPLRSREQAWCRVRVWTDRGLTVWSEPLRLEGGLFAQDDWLARPISPLSNVNVIDPAPVPLLRRIFEMTRPVARARLHITARGVWECWINGRSVAEDLLEPGWTGYPRRHLFATYDVTGLLSQGANAIAACVGDGWWRGNLTWTMQRAFYGDTTALLAQLEIVFEDGAKEIVGTDATWKGGTGALRLADIYNGCELDLSREPDGWKLPGYSDQTWEPVTELPMIANLRPRVMPPVRIVREFDVGPVTTARSTLTVDCGENLTGFLRITASSERDATIRVRHAEVLEEDDRLHTAALRQARATDTYRVPAGTHVLQPSFTYHGFRYAEIEVEGGADVLTVTACVVSSDLAQIGEFACSDDRVNRLFANVLRSQRGNFIAIPTDCPQRDERLGWTGDIQVFSPTACANLDSRTFLASWLEDLALEQRADGQVPSVVPNVIAGHPYEFGGVGWADAAVLVPWALYEAYGDPNLLAKEFASMRAYVDWAASRRNGEGVWIGDFHLGDWLDPNAPPDRPEEATTNRDLIASCYLSRCARVTARAASALGHAELARRYASLADEVASASWRHWRNSLVETQTGCALAIEFGIAPPEQLSFVGERLAALVAGGEGRVATGFLGTPLLLPALTSTGQDAAAYAVLLNEEPPGWLYQVRSGATTMWERWDAILPDGSLNRGEMAVDDAASMISFNHYAYGSVGAWLYRTLAGIAPDEERPGYAMIRFRPVPGGGISWARGAIETPFGRASIDWKIEGRLLDARLVVPAGAMAAFAVPDGWLSDGAMPADPLGSGEHRIFLRRK